MNWQQYPSADRMYATLGALVLTAQPNGAWSVHDSLFRCTPQNSVFAPVMGPKDLGGAMLAAEQAAKAMTEEVKNAAAIDVGGVVWEVLKA